MLPLRLPNWLCQRAGRTQAGNRERPQRAQFSGVHALFVLPVAGAWIAALWYKSAPYRSRAVIDPRGVLREFGTDHVWDSTAELRYIVVPERPAGTEI